MRPTFQITAAGSDITGDIAERLISIEIQDTVDEQTDALSIILSDGEQTLALPASGAKLEVSIGWDGQNQRVGSFVVDEVAVAGPPDQVTVQASSTPFVNDRGGGGKAAFVGRKSRSFEDKTIGEICQTVAGECGLTAIVDDTLKDIKIPHIAQTDESSANLLVRIARRYGGVLKPADGKLVLASETGGRTTSGQPLEITIDIKDVSSWTFKIGGKNQGVKKVKAKSHNYETADVEESEADVGDDQFGVED